MKRLIIITAAIALAVSVPAARAQVVYEFALDGPANWYTGGGWTVGGVASGFVPSREFGEIGAVSANRSAFVDADMADQLFAGSEANPAEVRVGVGIGAGTGGLLEIRNGGTFRVQQDIAAAADGGAEVGSFGLRGVLRVLTGGSMTVDNALTLAVRQAPNPSSRVEVGGTLNVGSATIGGVLQTLVGSDFNSLGALTFDGAGTFQVEVTSSNNAMVDVTGAAELDGTMIVDFTSFTPTLGQSWAVLEAETITGNFDAINSAILGPGTSFITSRVPVGDRQQLNITYSPALVLNVDRDTGAITMSNPNPAGVSFDGYSVLSGSGMLDPIAWTSLDDTDSLGGDWRESNASANQLAELKPTGVGTVSGNTDQPFGLAFLPFASSFGTLEDLTFDYTLDDGSVAIASVVYAGTRVNNLLLQVDSSGQAKLRNTSQTTVEIDAFDIASASGSLDDAAFTGLGGDWVTSAISDEFQLAQLNPASTTTLAPGASFDLGDIFVGVDESDKDLVISFVLDGNLTSTIGVVVYADTILGDYNGNGVVDAADYTSWRDRLNQSVTLNGERPDAATPGVVDQEDYQFWVSRFGATSNPGSGSLASNSANVPEPATYLMFMLGIACAGRLSRRMSV